MAHHSKYTANIKWFSDCPVIILQFPCSFSFLLPWLTSPTLKSLLVPLQYSLSGDCHASYFSENVAAIRKESLLSSLCLLPIPIFTLIYQERPNLQLVYQTPSLFANPWTLFQKIPPNTLCSTDLSHDQTLNESFQNCLSLLSASSLILQPKETNFTVSKLLSPFIFVRILQVQLNFYIQTKKITEHIPSYMQLNK